MGTTHKILVLYNQYNNWGKNTSFLLLELKAKLTTTLSH